MLLRVLLVTILIFVLLKVIFSVVNYVRLSQRNSQDKSEAPQVNQLVKDPVCGVYVAISEAESLPYKERQFVLLFRPMSSEILRRAEIIRPWR